MSTQTPWQVQEEPTRRYEGDDELVRAVTVRRFDLQSGWGYLCAAALSLVTLLLLFQPWLSAAGANGTITIDAFGNVLAWPKEYGRPDSGVSGVWAAPAAAAAVVTIGAVLLRLWIPVRSLSRVVLASASAAALFVVADRYYLDRKAAELRALTERSDVLDGSLGDLLDTLLTGNRNPVADSGTSGAAGSGFELAATLSCGTAAAAVFVALLALLWYPGKAVAAVQPVAAPREVAYGAPGGSGNRKSGNRKLGNRIEAPIIISASMDPSEYWTPRTKTMVPGITSDTSVPARTKTLVSAFV
ncbi:hypothetical protein [Nocardia mangyaensis]|uniref:hypothetical protein n=1 Tax=Nocardia mangyaensis TaxID=2213200 RepID=UPI002676A9FC|nr:hypothetical protein [Nocardia mangyaensis]MDO3648227.1 hypothetical protein [Nocardia mangyaensis]